MTSLVPRTDDSGLHYLHNRYGLFSLMSHKLLSERKISLSDVFAFSLKRNRHGLVSITHQIPQTWWFHVHFMVVSC